MLNVYIGREELEVLNDIKYRCYFSTIPEMEVFWERVAKAAGASTATEIALNRYKDAFNEAHEILHEEGRRVLSGTFAKSFNRFKYL